MSAIQRLPTIVGEATDNAIVFLFNLSKSIKAILLVDDIEYAGYEIGTGPYRVLVDGLDNTSKKYKWMVDGELLSEHDLRNGIQKIAFVSCDLIEGDTENSLWNRLETENVDLCCHLGDNVYADSAYNKTTGDHRKHYDKRYIKTWKTWAHKLLNCQHLMVADDHEITDNWDIRQDVNPKVEIALEMFDKYQQALLQQNSELGYIRKEYNGTTLLLLSRTMMEKSVLEKLKEIKDTLDGDIIIAMSSAPVPMPTGYEGTIYNAIFGSTGWSDEELLELYNFCFELYESGKAKTILLIGGDIHVGVQATIEHSNHKLYVYVTSPITAHPTIVESLYARGLNNTKVFGRYNTTFNARADRNYLHLTLPLQHDNPAALVYSDEAKPASVIRYIKQIAKMAMK